MVAAVYVRAIWRDQFKRFFIDRRAGHLCTGVAGTRLAGTLLYWVGLAVLIYSYVRIFSRNIPKRAAENRWYLAKQAAVSQRFSSMKTRWRMRQTYRYFRCPHCRQELRVPRGRGRISITCPKCGTSFIKKS